MIPRIRDQIALVTGANSGIGLATAHALLEAGYRVAAIDSRIDQVVNTLGSFGDRIECVAMELGDALRAQKICERVETLFGRIDVCINNAVSMPYANCEETTAEIWQKTMRLNLDSVFYVSQRLAPAMKSRGFGRIVNVSFGEGFIGATASFPAYSASNSGIASLTTSFAREYAPFGVTCNAIAPTFVRMHDLNGQISAEHQAQIIKKIPVGRLCEMDELIHCILFLAHPLSGFITGEKLDLKGGGSI